MSTITVEKDGMKYTGSIEDVMALITKMQSPIHSDPSKQSAVVMPNEVRTSKVKPDSKEFPTIGDDKAYVLGCSKVYPTLKLVRHWEGEFRPKNVRYAVKMSLMDGGATWNKNHEAYEFHTKKDFDAWVKAQKARLKK